MRFSEAERRIYRGPDGLDRDPLEVLLRLRAAAGGTDRFNALLDDLDEYRRLLGEGGQSDELARADVAAANAELLLAKIARVGFDLGEVLAAPALDLLYHFLEYIEGKGGPAASGPTSRPDMAGASSSPSASGVGLPEGMSSAPPPTRSLSP